MSELVPFEQTDSGWLDKKTEEIRELSKRTAINILLIGRHLAEVQANMRYKGFVEWMDNEFAWKRSHAYKMIQAWNAFGDAYNKAIANFEPTALYILSAPGAKPEYRQLAIERAEAGQKVTTKYAREIMGCNNIGDFNRKEVNKYHKSKKELNTSKPEDDRPAGEWDNEELALVAWNSFKNLCDSVSRFTIERVEDDELENCPHSAPWICRVTDRDGKVTHHMSTDGIEALIMNVSVCDAISGSRYWMDLVGSGRITWDDQLGAVLVRLHG
jgi:hypothetical protein